MSIKAYELMALAAKEPEKYQGKKFRVVNGAAISYGSKHAYTEVVFDGDDFVNQVGNSFRLFFSSITELEEILPYVTFEEATKSEMRIKHDNWGGYVCLSGAIYLLSTYPSKSLRTMLSEKKWLVEPEG